MMIFSVFAYISAIPPATLDSTADDLVVSMETTNLRLLQRVAAVERFYESMDGRVDAVLAVEEAMEISDENNRN